VFVWRHSKDGRLSAKDAFFHLFPKPPALPWAALIWCNYIPPSHSFILWRIIHDKMPTEDKLRERGCNIVSVCSLCLGAYETTTHLFFTCPFASAMWAWVGNLLRCQLEFSSPVSLLLRCLEGLHANVKHIALSATIHTVTPFILFGWPVMTSNLIMLGYPFTRPL
jgi:hypothetical protein